MEDTISNPDAINTISTEDPLNIKDTARKQLREIASTSSFDKKKYSLKEYLSQKRASDINLSQLITEAQLDEKSATSLIQLLESKEYGDENNDEEQFNKLEEEKIDENTSSTKNKTNSEGDNSDKKEEKKVEEIKDNEADDIKEPKNDEINGINVEDDEIIGESNEPLNEALGPLEGKQIVITGETLIPKEYFRVLLARLGARVTYSVSSKTTLLIYGNRLEDGRRYWEGIKYKAAVEREIPTYSDKEFEEYMQDLLKDKKWNLRDQVEVMEGRDKIVVKKIKKILMGSCPYSTNVRTREEFKLDKKKERREKEKELQRKKREKEKKKKDKKSRKKSKHSSSESDSSDSESSSSDSSSSSSSSSS